MKIVFKVEDFLKIEKAEIDITNFCVFIGNNNSGKTKLMELIYGTLEYLSSKTPDINYEFENDRVVFHKERLAEFVNFANEVLENEKDEILQSIFNKEMSIGNMRLEVEGFEEEYEVILLTRKNADIVYSENADLRRVFRNAKDVLKETNSVIINKYRENGEASCKLLSMTFYPGEEIDFKAVKENINKTILEKVLGVTGSRLFLPASRMGLAMLYREYFNSVGRERTRWFDGKQSFDRDTYQQSDHVTRPVLDFLRFLQGYSYNVSRAKSNADLIEFMNEHLLEGALDEKGEMASYTPKNSDLRVPLYLSSSMINELDPIVKMLTDRKGTTMLFYDEIEKSLHPLKQLEMVKLLNRLNNSGIRIIVATHSDTFVTKLNNLLLLSRTKKVGKRPVSIRSGEIEINSDDLLKNDDIHIYQFINKNNGRSEVSELEFRTAPMVGYSFELFEDSSTSLFEEAKLALGIE